MQPETFKLSNGIEVRLWRRSELPLVSVKLLLGGGASQDDAAQAGRTYLMAAMLDEGRGKVWVRSNSATRSISLAHRFRPTVRRSPPA